MFRLTDNAKGKLREELRERADDPAVSIRIIISPRGKSKIEFVLDREKENDEVIKDKDGLKLLLVGPGLSQTLDGMYMDYQRTPGGEGFVISARPPGNLFEENN